MENKLIGAEELLKIHNKVSQVFTDEILKKIGINLLFLEEEISEENKDIATENLLLLQDLVQAICGTHLACVI